MLKLMRFSVLALPVLAVTALAACDDETSGIIDERLRPVAVEVTVDTSVVVVRSDSTARDTLHIQRGNNNATFRFLNAAGNEITGFAGDTAFSLIITPSNNRLTYTPTTTLTGVLTGNSAGMSSFTVTLRHRDHTDFGPSTVPVVVR